MAYLRNEKETIEVDYPLEKIWAAIPETVKVLEWTIEAKNDDSHKVKVKTKGGFMAYSSSLEIEVNTSGRENYSNNPKRRDPGYYNNFNYRFRKNKRPHGAIH